METGRRRAWPALVALALAACASPTEGSELPPFSTSAPSTTELFDIAERDPLPFNAALRADNNYLHQTPAVAEVLRIL